MEKRLPGGKIREVTVSRVRGITLLEILVAFGVLALFLIPFLNAFLTAKKGTTMTGDYNQALYLAQKVIEDIRYSAYNEQTPDFMQYMATITYEEDSEDNLVVPTGTTVEGQSSAFFQQVFDPENNPVDNVLVKRMDKFVITTTWEQATDDNQVPDPNSAIVRVQVSWQEPVRENREILIPRRVNLYTVISQARRIPTMLGGASGP